MPRAPQLSPEQRRAALAQAAQARVVRAEARARLKAGTLTLAEFLRLAEREPRLGSMRVSALISALPGYGDARTRQLMDQLTIADSRRVRGLGPRQRDGLLARVGNAAESTP